MQLLGPWLTDKGEKTAQAMRWLFGCWLLLGMASGSVAQNVCNDSRYNTYKGEFSLDKAKVCVGTLVNITNVPANLVSSGYVYEYDGSEGIPTKTVTFLNHTYTKPGSYTIVQVGSGNGAGTGTIACRVVDVVATTPVNFTVTPCSDRRVLVNVSLDDNTSKYDNFLVNWGDGTADPKSRADVTNQFSHTYATNAVRTVTISGQYNAPATCSGQPKSLTVAVAPPASRPIIRALTTLNNNTISIQYTAGAGTTVQLLQKDNSGIYVNTGKTGSGPSGTFTVETNASQVQCFQVAYQDACQSVTSRSEEVCSLLLEAKAANKQNQLSWQPYVGSGTPFRQYRLTRNGTAIGGTLTSRNSGSYNDNNRIECGVQYCYTLEATVGPTGTPTVVTSAPSCATGLNTDVPGDFRTVVVSVENNRPRVTASLPITGTSASYTIAVSRASDASGSFQPVGTITNKNLYVDEGADASAGSYCYQLTYQNNCGLSSAPSKPVCSVYLSSQSASTIDWTTAAPFTPGTVANYTLEVIDSLNGTRREINLGTNTKYEPDPNDPNLQSQRYRIIAESQAGLSSYSNFFTFRREARILAPDAFSPNGDGMNDSFTIKGVYVDQFSLTIFNRWGEVIYNTTDRQKGWDGNFNGQPALEGQYMFRVEIQDLTGQKTVRTGRLLLLR